VRGTVVCEGNKYFSRNRSVWLISEERNANAMETVSTHPQLTKLAAVFASSLLQGLSIAKRLPVATTVYSLFIALVPVNEQSPLRWDS